MVSVYFFIKINFVLTYNFIICKPKETCEVLSSTTDSTIKLQVCLTINCTTLLPVPNRIPIIRKPVIHKPKLSTDYVCNNNI